MLTTILILVLGGVSAAAAACIAEAPAEVDVPPGLEALRKLVNR